MATTLKEKIQTAFDEARKAQDKVKLSALETVKALILTAEKAPGRTNPALSEEETVAVVTKSVKQYNESLEAFKTAGRDDKIASIQAEIDVLKPYLPQLMSELEIQKALAPLVEQAGGNVGKLMGLFNKTYPKKADNALVKKHAEVLILQTV